MMKVKSIYRVILISITMMVFLTGCKTLFTPEGKLYSEAKSLVKQDNYDQAVDNLVRAVALDPEYKKAIVLLNEIYPEGLSFYRNELERTDVEKSPEAADYRVRIYRGLTRIVDAGKKLPATVHPETGVELIFETPDYSEELKTAVTAAAETWYQEGIKLAASGERNDSKEASRAFIRALEYVPGYRDAEELEKSARKSGMQILAFLPLRGDNYRYSGLDVNEMLLDEVISGTIADSRVSEYTKVVDRSLVDHLLLEQKLYSSGLFDESSSVEIGRLLQANIAFYGTNVLTTVQIPETTVKSVNRSADVTPTEEELEEGEDDITVEADIRLYERSSGAKLIVNFRLINIETGEILLSDTLREERSDSASWVRFEGDIRVLTSGEIALLNNIDRDVEDSDVMMVECVEEMGEKIASVLIGYLK